MKFNMVSFLLNILAILFITCTCDKSLARQKRNLLIADGTKWCGAGNIADSCDDLGEYKETDKCCREHDYCPYSFSDSDPVFNGFHWNGFYSTVSACECDKRFYECLTKIEHEAGSEFVKSAFFEGLKIPCFSYIPCKPDEIDNTNPFIRPGLKRIGECIDGHKVRVFMSFDEYDEYINNYLNDDEKIKLFEILKHPERIMMDRKKQAKCIDSFSHMPEYVSESYKNSFLNQKNIVSHEFVELEDLMSNKIMQANSTANTTDSQQPSDSIFNMETNPLPFMIFFIILGIVVLIFIIAIMCLIISNFSKPKYKVII